MNNHMKLKYELKQEKTLFIVTITNLRLAIEWFFSFSLWKLLSLIHWTFFQAFIDLFSQSSNVIFAHYHIAISRRIQSILCTIYSFRFWLLLKCNDLDFMNINVQCMEKPIWRAIQWLLKVFQYILRATQFIIINLFFYHRTESNIYDSILLSNAFNESTCQTAISCPMHKLCEYSKL